MSETPSPASAELPSRDPAPKLSPAGIPVSPIKVSVESRLATPVENDKEAERILKDLLDRLDRNQATPAEQAMVERRIQVIQLTCAELRAACKKSPSHDLALHFMQATKSYTDQQVICIEQPDLEALVHNRKMVMRHQVIGDTVVMTKEVHDN